MKRYFQKTVILAEGRFSPFGSKTANCVIRFLPERVAAVIDSANRGRTAADVLGFGHGIPVVADLDGALALRPDSLLIGIAPPGGGLPAAWRPLIADAMRAGLNVASGLHYFLGDDAEFRELAALRNVVIWDLRRVPDEIPLTPELPKDGFPFVVLVAGTDCDTGKMTTSFLLASALREKGLRAAVAPTGQTGIFIAGRGMAIDRVISDFVVGATETLLIETVRAESPDVILVEGQGTVLHPVYGAVAHGLLLGAHADAIVLCHAPGRSTYIHFAQPIPDIGEVIRIHEDIASFQKPAHVIAAALCAPDFDRHKAAHMARELEARLGFPVEDPVSGGLERLAAAVSGALKARGRPNGKLGSRPGAGRPHPNRPADQGERRHR